MLKLLRFFRGFRKEEDGGATVEFVILFPAFIGILLSSYESGLMMVRNVMLERGVDLAVRDLRLGQPIPPTFDQLKTTICDNAMIVDDCFNKIQVELQPIDTGTWAMPNTQPLCIDVNNGSINPIDDTTFIGGGNNELMLVRVCAIMDPFFPSTVLGMQMPEHPNSAGRYALVVNSAFVNEPSR